MEEEEEAEEEETEKVWIEELQTFFLLVVLLYSLAMSS